jgi:hypothetical protein
MKNDRFDREATAWTHWFECGLQVIHIKIWPYPSDSANCPRPPGAVKRP